MTRFPESSRVWAAIPFFTACVFTALNTRAEDLPPLPPTSVPSSPPPPPEALPPSAAPPTSDATVEVRYKPSDPGLKLLGSAIGDAPARSFGLPYVTVFVPTPICDGPCTTRLPPDSYRLALANKEGRVIPVPDPVVIQGASTLHAEYRDRSNLRSVGAATGIIGLLAGCVMMAADSGTEQACDPQGFCVDKPWQPGPLWGGGLMVVILSLGIGYVLSDQHDTVRVSVEPLMARAAPGESFAALSVSQRMGAALALHF
jgi:hypothetical protein